MPRQSRIVLPGYFHHVTQRGNYQQSIFLSNQDRAVYLKYIDENAQQYGLNIYAFCLMDNHVHFIVMPINHDALAKTFRVGHQRYSLYVNKRGNQIGHLWQSRFYSCVLLGEHIPRAIRYVERNPVRAGLVSHPNEFTWSSAKARSGKKYNIILLSDINKHITIDSWKKFLSVDDTPADLDEIRKNTSQGKVLGDLPAVQTLEQQTKRKLLFTPKGRPKK